jgi:precorrin-6B methylase 2
MNASFSQTPAAGSSETPPAVRMLELLSAYTVSQALITVAKLGVATILADGPRTVAELAAATDSKPDQLGRVIRYLVPYGVFTVEDETVNATSLGLTLAVGRPDSMWGIAHSEEINYGLARDMLYAVQTGNDAATKQFGKPFFEWISEDPERVAHLTTAMANSTDALRAGIFDNYRLPDGAVVADIGGSDGTILSELLIRNPDRRGILFDLPHVVPASQEKLKSAGVADRVEVVGGDAFAGVPEADIYILSMVLHDWNDEDSRRILHSIARTAKSGARLILIEMVMPENDLPHLSRVTDLIMMVAAAGRERTVTDYRALLATDGFMVDRVISTQSPYSFVEATLK